MKPSYYYTVPFESTELFRRKLDRLAIPFRLERDEDGNTMFLLPDLAARNYARVRELFGREYDGTVRWFS